MSNDINTCNKYRKERVEELKTFQQILEEIKDLKQVVAELYHFLVQKDE